MVAKSTLSLSSSFKIYCHYSNSQFLLRSKRHAFCVPHLASSCTLDVVIHPHLEDIADRFPVHLRGSIHCSLMSTVSTPCPVLDERFHFNESLLSTSVDKFVEPFL